MLRECPNCGGGLVTRFEGDAIIGTCPLCGYERAIKPEDNTKQTRLYPK